MEKNCMTNMTNTINDFKQEIISELALQLLPTKGVNYEFR